jgi:hypothetical protein
MAWTAKAGHKEYPFYLLGIPFVELVTLDTGFDNSDNRLHSILISHWQRNRWLARGGDDETSSVLPLPVANTVRVSNLRRSLRIPKESFVVGFHQREDNQIVSNIPFEAVAAMNNPNIHFLLMGGGNKYKEISTDFGVKSTFLKHNSDWIAISRFLRTLDVYTHGRSDGETFASTIAEAMSYGIPVISHKSQYGSNAHVETIEKGGYFTYSTSEYISALMTLIERKDLRDQIGSEGASFAKEAYSEDAFRQNLTRILIKLGILRPKLGDKSTQSLDTVAPLAIPGTRILVHALSSIQATKAILLQEKTIAITEIFRDLKFNEPSLIHITNLQSALIAVEIGRVLQNCTFVVHKNEKNFQDSLEQTLKANGIYEVIICQDKEHKVSGKYDAIFDFAKVQHSVSKKDSFCSENTIDEKQIRKVKFWVTSRSLEKSHLKSSKILILNFEAKRYNFFVNTKWSNLKFLRKYFTMLLDMRIQQSKTNKRVLHTIFLIKKFYQTNR